jgi:hypothetical protein
MFLLNSWLNHFTETISLWYALSRSYSVNLPSSFSTAHPSTLGYSPRLPVSVCGTGCFKRTLEVFLGGMIRTTISFARSIAVLSRSTSQTHLTIQDISTRFNGNFRCPAGLSQPRHSIEFKAGIRILTHFPSTAPFGFA